MKLITLLENTQRSLYNTDGKINLSATKEAMDFMIKLFKRPMASDRKVLEIAYKNLDKFDNSTYKSIIHQKASEDKNIIASLAILGNELNKPNADKDVAEEIKSILIDNVAKALQLSTEDEKTNLLEKLKTFGSNEKSSRSITKILSTPTEQKPVDEKPVEKPATELATPETIKLDTPSLETQNLEQKPAENTIGSTSTYTDFIQKIPDPNFGLDKIRPGIDNIYNTLKNKLDDTLRKLREAKEKLQQTSVAESIIYEAINMENSQELDKFINIYTDALNKLDTEYKKYINYFIGKEKNIGKEHVIINPKNYDRAQTTAIKKASITFLSTMSQLDRNIIRKEFPSTIQNLISGIKTVGKDIASTSGFKAAQKIYGKIKETGQILGKSLESNLVKNETNSLKDYYSQEEKTKMQEISNLEKENPQEYLKQMDAINTQVKQRAKAPEIIEVKNLIAKAKQNQKSEISGPAVILEKEFLESLKPMISSGKIDTGKLNQIKTKIEQIISGQSKQEKPVDNTTIKTSTNKDFKDTVKKYIKK